MDGMLSEKTEPGGGSMTICNERCASLACLLSSTSLSSSEGYLTESGSFEHDKHIPHFQNRSTTIS